MQRSRIATVLRVGLSALLSFGLAACVHEAPSRQLRDARSAYVQALNAGAATYAAADLIAARDALTSAEIASREGSHEADQLALGARRRALIATARATRAAADEVALRNAGLSAPP